MTLNPLTFASRIHRQAPHRSPEINRQIRFSRHPPRPRPQGPPSTPPSTPPSPPPQGSGLVAGATSKKVLAYAGIQVNTPPPPPTPLCTPPPPPPLSNTLPQDVFTQSTGHTKTLGNFVKVP